MRYDDKRAMLLASPDELAGAAASLQLSRGLLSTTLFDIGGPEQTRIFEDGLVRLDEQQRNIFEVALPIACDPARSAMLHIRDTEMVGRSFLAWSAGGTLVSVAQLGKELGLRSLDPDQVMIEILASLRADVPFGGSDVRTTLEARDALCLVAMADAYRREWLESLLNHAPARTMLAASDVADAIAASAVDDPRWTSCLLDKVIPAPLRDVMDTPTTELALGRLAEAGVLSVIDGDPTAPDLYTPTEDAAAVVEGISGAESAVAITVYGMTDAGPGYETTLFARDAGTVWTVMLSPTESFVASASPTALAALVGAALGIAAR